MNKRTQKKKGFTLVEMIGVLAIIAVLAAVTLPKVFETIKTSKINATISSVNALKTATVDFAAKYGTPPTTGGVQSAVRYDDLLVAAGFLESRFSTKLGSNTDPNAIAGAVWTNPGTGWTSTGGTAQTNMTVVNVRTSNTANPPSGGRNFRLDGTTNMPAGSRVIAIRIDNVTQSEARALSEAIDGTTLSTTTGADALGKVAYGGGNNPDVYIYVAHF